MTQHVVMFSGGESSAFTGRLVAQAQGFDSLQLLFTDTLAEDTDLYRFLVETAFVIFNQRCPGEIVQLARNVPEWHEKRFVRRQYLSALRGLMNAQLPQLIWLVDGRDPWELYRDERFLGNSRIDPCSKFLKRVPANRWLNLNCNPHETIVYVGIDWTEQHRIDDGKGKGIRPRRLKDGWDYRAPMCEAPFYDRSHAVEWLQALDIERPRLTREKYSHNNCSGMCCKAGVGHWSHHLEMHPERFDFCADEEQGVIEFLGRDIAMMQRTRGGKKRPLPLTRLREEIHAGAIVDKFEIGGCGCFIDDDADE